LTPASAVAICLMATNATFVEYVAEQAALGARLTYKKMFGEFGLYVDGKVVALACDNSLFLKPTPADSILPPDTPRRSPYPGAKLHAVLDEYLDDSELLRKLLVACADVLPAPEPKASKARRKRGG
jgi:TfoX/Sxy family transcriptional regulator of competence genes